MTSQGLLYFFSQGQNQNSPITAKGKWNISGEEDLKGHWFAKPKPMAA